MENKIRKFMFYDLYWVLIKNTSNKVAGRFVKRLCTAIFTDNKLSDLEDKEEAFVWSNIEDIVNRSKDAELNGKVMKSYNQKMEHFVFFERYYRAIELLNEEQSGVYIKALCEYMFDNVERQKLVSPVDKYYALAKLKLSLSKKRSKAAKTESKKVDNCNIKTKKNKQSNIAVSKSNETKKLLTFDEFMVMHPTIKDDIFPNARNMLTAINWSILNDIINEDERLSKNHSLYWILQDEKVKKAKQNG